MVMGRPWREQGVFMEKKTLRNYTTMKQEQDATFSKKEPTENTEQPLEIKILGRK